VALAEEVSAIAVVVADLDAEVEIVEDVEEAIAVVEVDSAVAVAEIAVVVVADLAVAVAEEVDPLAEPIAKLVKAIGLVQAAETTISLFASPATNVKRRKRVMTVTTIPAVVVDTEAVDAVVEDLEDAVVVRCAVEEMVAVVGTAIKAEVARVLIKFRIRRNVGENLEIQWIRITFRGHTNCDVHGLTISLHHFPN